MERTLLRVLMVLRRPVGVRWRAHTDVRDESGGANLLKYEQGEKERGATTRTKIETQSQRPMRDGEINKPRPFFLL